MRNLKITTFLFMIVLLFFAANVSAQKALPANVDDNSVIVITEQKRVNGKTVLSETTTTAGEIRAKQKAAEIQKERARKIAKLRHAKEFLKQTKKLDQATLETEKYQIAIAHNHKLIQQLEKELASNE